MNQIDVTLLLSATAPQLSEGKVYSVDGRVTLSYRHLDKLHAWTHRYVPDRVRTADCLVSTQTDERVVPLLREPSASREFRGETFAWTPADAEALALALFASDVPAVPEPSLADGPSRSLADLVALDDEDLIELLITSVTVWEPAGRLARAIGNSRVLMMEAFQEHQEQGHPVCGMQEHLNHSSREALREWAQDEWSLIDGDDVSSQLDEVGTLLQEVRDALP